MLDSILEILIPLFLGGGLIIEAILAHTQPEKYLAWVAKRNILRVRQYPDATKLFYGRFIYPVLGLGLVVLAFLSFVGAI